MTGPSPRLNTTPMAAALSCLQNQGAPPASRIGVSDFVDGTGAMDGGTQNSRAFSQRPDMMMVVALASAGAHLVNRSSVNVAEWEMGKAIEKKLGDGREVVVDAQKINYRPIKTGTILGSSHYITGAVTEMNWNIDSKVAEGGAFGGYVGKRTYRISIAVDVVVTDTQSTEIVFAKSYKKQLVGFETNANFFRFVNRAQAVAVASLGTASAAAASAAQALEVFEANVGEKQNEPTQTALRWVIELAGYDIVRHLGRKGESCNRLLPPGSLDSYNTVVAGGEDQAESKPAVRQAAIRREEADEVETAKAPMPGGGQKTAASAPDEGKAKPPAGRTRAAGSSTPRFTELSSEIDAAFARTSPQTQPTRNDVWPYGGMPAPQPVETVERPAAQTARAPQSAPAPVQAPMQAPKQAPVQAPVQAPMPAPIQARSPDETGSIPQERAAARANAAAAQRAQAEPAASPPPKRRDNWLDGAVPALGTGFTPKDETGS